MSISKGGAGKSRIMAAKRKTKAERSKMIKNYKDKRKASTSTDSAVAARRKARPAAEGSKDAMADIARAAAASVVPSAAPSAPSKPFDSNLGRNLGIAGLGAAGVVGGMSIAPSMANRMSKTGISSGGRPYGIEALESAQSRGIANSMAPLGPKPAGKTGVAGFVSRPMRSAGASGISSGSLLQNTPNPGNTTKAGLMNDTFGKNALPTGPLPAPAGGTGAGLARDMGRTYPGAAVSPHTPPSMSPSPALPAGSSGGLWRGGSSYGGNQSTAAGLARDAGVSPAATPRGRPYTGFNDFVSREASKPGSSAESMADRAKFWEEYGADEMEEYINGDKDIPGTEKIRAVQAELPAKPTKASLTRFIRNNKGRFSPDDMYDAMMEMYGTNIRKLPAFLKGGGLENFIKSVL